ncbi:MT-A70 family methyltransferase [Mesorhizobium sp. DCY119]|uniref:MT-A70 family methyltransferase n=1 Tax=Mesorhizobium sp. DCY119 TaxID=2108445 RepID=UPI000E6C0566|nr:MT-A70 family methyltransferase [Mesorhizobium sp. DCY119]RJG46460.1 hypothetical protein D3Y55_20920 [Mesorhizobium sp. DCY119]
MTWPFHGLTPLKYGGLLIDPCYRYEMRSEKGYEKSPEAHYETMSEDELAALPVGYLASGNCLLWMWSTWPHLPVAMRLMKHYGFTYKTGGAWVKRTPKGKPTFGTGYILRSSTEPFLIGTIGEPVVRSKSVRNLIDSIRREHSRKPPEARAMMSALLPDQFMAELFAREPWPGNDVWGNETAKFSVSEPGLHDDFPHPVAMSDPVGGVGMADAKDGAFQIAAGNAVLESGIGNGLFGDQTGDSIQVERDPAAFLSGRDRHGDAERPIVGKGGRAGRKDKEHGKQVAHGLDGNRPRRWGKV